MITIVDVAKKAEVSPTTVSRVINGHAKISTKTKSKVFRAMKELNYYPNEAARSLTTKRTHIIGLIVPIVDHPYFAMFIEAIGKVCAQAGYKLLLCTTGYSEEKELNLATMLRANQVDGVLIYSQLTDASVYVELKLPAVTIDRDIPGMSSVMCDNYQGGVLAARTLIENGSRHPVAFEYEDTSIRIGMQRYQGFHDECKRLGVEYQDEIVEGKDALTVPVEPYFDMFMKEHPETDGIFTTNDILASRILAQCMENHIAVPDRLQIIGYDGTYISKLMGITTVTQPLDKMCAYALEMLVKQIEGEVTPSDIVFPAAVVCRRTTRKRE
jgi:LacI family transcriptional regulator, sucrose operon repressor